jgi:hypothetical protein
LRLFGTLERQWRNRLARRNARYRRVQASGELGTGIGQGSAVVTGDCKACDYSLSACAFAVAPSCKFERIDVDVPSNALLAHPLEQRPPARQELV